MITASIAVNSWLSMSTWRPSGASRPLRIPWLAKTRMATIPITTHEIAVGRK
jgi:hypothetical protein